MPAVRRLVNRGEASVRVGEDPILDQLTLIGKVFNDRNQNGIQDAGMGEQGLPGVRVISLTGLIITTDQHGRFSRARCQRWGA